MKIQNILITTSLLSLAGGHMKAQKHPNVVIIYLDDISGGQQRRPMTPYCLT